MAWRSWCNPAFSPALCWRWHDHRPSIATLTFLVGAFTTFVFGVTAGVIAIAAVLATVFTAAAVLAATVLATAVFATAVFATASVVTASIFTAAVLATTSAIFAALAAAPVVVLGERLGKQAVAVGGKCHRQHGKTDGQAEDSRGLQQEPRKSCALTPSGQVIEAVSVPREIEGISGQRLTSNSIHGPSPHSANAGSSEPISQGD
jgi:hypothetical protein